MKPNEIKLQEVSGFWLAWCQPISGGCISEDKKTAIKACKKIMKDHRIEGPYRVKEP